MGIWKTKIKPEPHISFLQSKLQQCILFKTAERGTFEIENVCWRNKATGSKLNTCVGKPPRFKCSDWSRVSFAFRLWSWRIWSVESNLASEVNLHQGSRRERRPQKHCLRAGANQNTTPTHSRIPTANHSSIMDMFWTDPQSDCQNKHTADRGRFHSRSNQWLQKKDRSGLEMTATKNEEEKKSEFLSYSCCGVTTAVHVRIQHWVKKRTDAKTKTREEESMYNCNYSQIQRQTLFLCCWFISRGDFRRVMHVLKTSSTYKINNIYVVLLGPKPRTLLSVLLYILVKVYVMLY